MQLATPYLFNFYIDFPHNNNVFCFQPSIFDIFDKIDKIDCNKHVGIIKIDMYREIAFFY